ncbi:PadR family transcriptional regulator [Larkinella arboricola]
MTTAHQEFLWKTLKTIIMQVLNQHGRMYGYEINRAVQNRTDGNLTLTFGMVYPLLHQLEREGALLTQTEEVDGRPRKYYCPRPSTGLPTSRQPTGHERLIRMTQPFLKPSSTWAVCQ